MKIVVESKNVDVRSGIKNDRPWKIRTQEARLVGAWVAGRVSLNLRDDQEPYEVGEYELDLERSIDIGAYGAINMSRNPVLVPLSARQGTPKLAQA